MEPHLPQELVSNILSRLPAIDLVKCKSVCKSWFDLITDSHFVSNYYVAYNNLKHYQSQEEKLLVIGRPFVSALKTHISLLSCNTNNPKKNHVSSSLSNLPCEYNNSEHKYWSEISGPCNGIYFLEGNPNVLMNPSLGQFKALPKSHLSASQGTYSLTEYSGFGFDLKNNDYKVVVIRDIWLKETDERKQGHWTAELYSLNSNSWRKLDDASLPHPIEIWGSSRVYTYANNCYHWWGHDVDESGVKEDAVLAFDMVNDSFRKIKVPIIRGSSKEEFATLAPLKESATIGVVVYPLRGQEKSFDVWIMKNYWDEGSWVKQYTVEPIEAIYKFVGFYGSNQFPWSSCNEGLGWYDYEPATEKIKDLQVWGNNGSLRAARYMESLVSLRRGMSSVANLF
ncbi:F-box protein CPR1 [Glycine soja]|uniref:F-box domain-containing protein n=3 Tax=Glycine subgen. Soja TaxID=1462606 RepID=A0A0R0EV93_SOYBN|nr:F-box protein CPR30 [Glycine soja]